MRSIVHLAVALAFLQPALRGQPAFAGLEYYGKGPLYNHREGLIYTDKSGNCYFLVAGSPGPPKPLGNCAIAIFTATFEPKNSSRGAVLGARLRALAARPDASSSAPAQQIWIGSDTPPSTAPSAAGAIFVIDPSTLDTLASIPLPGSPSASPSSLAFNHAGTYAYAVISGPPGSGPAMIAAIQTSSYSVAQTINLTQGVIPGIPALSADDRYLYVPNNGTAGGVVVIDTQNPSSITTIPTKVTYPSSTQAIGVAQVALTPDGELLFAWGSYNIFVIDTTAAQQIGQILLPAEQGNRFIQNQQDKGSNYFLIDPTGSRIYAFANYGSGPSNTWTGYFYAYDTASLSLAGSVELAQNVDLDSIGISPDGSTVYVSAFVYADGVNPTFVIDTQSLAVTQANLTAPPLSMSDTGLWQTLLVVLQ